MKDDDHRRKRTYGPATRTPADSTPSSAVDSAQKSNGEQESKLFDNSLVGTPQGAVDFITNILGFFRDFARKKGPLAGQHTQEVETLLPSPLFFRDLCG